MTPATKTRFRAAIVGAGYVSQYHIRAIRSLPDVDLIGIADLDLDRARSMSAGHKIPEAVRTLQDLVRLSPDVIHVLTPPSSHCSVVIEALGMGSHVLVEKPMAASTEECDRMMAKAAQCGRTLSVNHSAQFDPVVQRALEAVRAGALGDVLHVAYFRGSDYPPYTGGPVPPHYGQGGYPYRDLGVHGLYLLEAFLGPVRNVDTRYRSSGRQPNLLFDEWQSSVECARGSGQIQLSWNARPMMNSLVIQGTNGTLELDLFLERWTLRRNLPGPKAASLIGNAISGALRDLWQVPWNTFRFATGMLKPSPDIHESVCQFYGALRVSAPPPVSADEGRRMVYWVEKAARAADAERSEMLALRAPVAPAKILVTGGTGFLGRCLIKRLAELGKTVRVMARRPARSPQPDGVSIVYGDLGDPSAVDRAVEGVEVVYHLGAAMNGGWGEHHAGTVAGTRNVVDSCVRHHVAKLVHVSSLAILDYAGLAPHPHISEQCPLEPFPDKRGHYAKSKLQAEEIVLAAVRDQALNAIILRPGQIFGPGAEQVPPYGTISLGGRWIVMGSGDALVPLVYVDDVVDAMLQAAEAGVASGSIYHIVDPSEITQREFLEFSKALIPHLAATFAPLWLLYLAATGLQALGKVLHRSVPLTWYRLRSLHAHLRFDSAAAQMGLGWTPRMGARMGLRHTYLGAAAAPLAEVSPESTAAVTQ